jgi:hypothetical protein
MAEQRNAGDEPLPAPKVKPVKIVELPEADPPPERRALLPLLPQLLAPQLDGTVAMVRELEAVASG